MKKLIMIFVMAGSFSSAAFAVTTGSGYYIDNGKATSCIVQAISGDTAVITVPALIGTKTIAVPCSKLINKSEIDKADQVANLDAPARMKFIEECVAARKGLGLNGYSSQEEADLQSHMFCASAYSL